MTFSRSQAFRAACCIYVAGSLVVLLLLWRIGSLLRMIGGDPKAVTRLATHTWLLNPFSYFGPHPFYNSLGYGCLIFLWWMCTASLSTLTGGLLTKANIAQLIFFLSVGGLVVLAANRVGRIILCSKSPTISAAFYNSFAPLGHERVIAPIVGLVLGIVAFVAIKFWIRSSRRQIA